MNNRLTAAEKRRNDRVKELMSKKHSPLVISGDTGLKEWNVKNILNTRHNDRDKMIFMDGLIREERKLTHRKYDESNS